MASTQKQTRPAPLDLADLVALRWDRATELLAASPRAYARAGDGLLYVWSDEPSAPFGHWTATVDRCDCLDSRSNRASGVCKHSILAFMVARMDREAAEGQAAVAEAGRVVERAGKLAPLVALFD